MLFRVLGLGGPLQTSSPQSLIPQHSPRNTHSLSLNPHPSSPNSNFNPLNCKTQVHCKAETIKPLGRKCGRTGTLIPNPQNAKPITQSHIPESFIKINQTPLKCQHQTPNPQKVWKHWEQSGTIATYWSESTLSSR